MCAYIECSFLCWVLMLFLLEQPSFSSPICNLILYIRLHSANHLTCKCNRISMKGEKYVLNKTLTEIKPMRILCKKKPSLKPPHAENRRCLLMRKWYGFTVQWVTVVHWGWGFCSVYFCRINYNMSWPGVAFPLCKHCKVSCYWLEDLGWERERHWTGDAVGRYMHSKANYRDVKRG